MLMMYKLSLLYQYFFITSTPRNFVIVDRIVWKPAVAAFLSFRIGSNCESTVKYLVLDFMLMEDAHARH